jgi:hypothetical protein
VVGLAVRPLDQPPTATDRRGDPRRPSKLQAMNESSSRSFGRTAFAALILLVAGWLLLGVVIHVVGFLLSTAVLIVAVVAVVWALRVLL